MEVIEWSEGHRVFLLPVVRGLESERIKVRQAVEDSAAKVIALSISEEELKGLDGYEGEEVPPANFEEDVYMAGLAKFGEVKKPPPCFLEARDLAKEKGLRVEPLDMNNADFTEAYVTNVSTLEMMSQSLAEGKLRAMRFMAKTPEGFVLEFDSTINRRKGFRQLEVAREKHMAKRLDGLVASNEAILAVIEAERAKGARQALDAYLPR